MPKTISLPRNTSLPLNCKNFLRSPPFSHSLWTATCCCVDSGHSSPLSIFCSLCWKPSIYFLNFTFFLFFVYSHNLPNILLSSESEMYAKAIKCQKKKLFLSDFEALSSLCSNFPSY